MLRFLKKGQLSSPSVRSTFYRYASTVFIDPFGVKDPRRANLRSEDLQKHNAITGYSKMIGDPNRGLADDTTVHPFGDLRINFVRMNSSNLCLWWEYDFTGGVIRNNGQNALLSNKTKDKIYALHLEDPERYSVEELAEMYKIRQQRIMAIIALKEIAETEMAQTETLREEYNDVQPPLLDIPPPEDKDQADSTDPGDSDKKPKKQIPDDQWYQLCDWAEREAFGATAEEGSGERHFVSVPTYPKFEEVPLSEAHKYAETEWSISKVNRMYTAKEDRFQIREFQEMIGKTLDFEMDRKAMRRSPPKTPTPLIVTSLDGEVRKPFVAEVDGTQRNLTSDEHLIWKRAHRETFTKLMTQKIEKQTQNEN